MSKILIKGRILILMSLFVLSTAIVSAQKVSLNFSQTSLKTILESITQQTNYTLAFSKEVVDLNSTATIQVNDTEVKQALDQLLSSRNIGYEIKGDKIYIYKKVTERKTSITDTAQQREVHITGKVEDEKGEPIIGANISIPNTTIGTVTDYDGTYSLSLPYGSQLKFSYIGYTDQNIRVTDQKQVNVVLIEDIEALDEVIVIGYGTVARKDVTTAVSTISTKDLDERPLVSAAQAMQGKAAGVHVYQPSGMPGGNIVVRVRGTTSFNGSNEPLYVVDGVPVDNLNFLSPNDIESMQILKDASSAAIYGSRAANGVVLITSKRASVGAKISANIQYGVSKVSNQINSLNASQYKELMDELRPGAIPEGITDKTNWFKEVYGSGVTQNYQLQVSDGNERLKYFVSAGYLDESGVLSSAFFKRFNLRSNVESQVRDWLNFGLNLSYSDNTSNGITTGQGSNRGGVVLAVVNLPTASTIRDEQSGLYNRQFFGQNITNPIEAIENGRNNKSKESRLIASGTATITFMPDLIFKSSFTLDKRNGKSTGFTPPSHGIDRDDWGSAWDNRSDNTLMIADNILTYKKIFAKMHNVEAMAGTSWTDSKWSQSYINGSHYKDSSIKTLNAANKITWNNTGSNAAGWGIMSAIWQVII